MRTEVDIELGIFDLLGRGPLLLHFELVELRTQHAHGTFAVLVLRALVLATDDNSGGIVGDAYRRIRRIDVLPAFSAGTIGIHSQVFWLNVYFDAFVDFWRDVHAGKGCVPPFGLIEGRDTHQSVHADFACQLPKCVLTVDPKRRRLDSCFFPRLVVIQDGLKSLALGPA